MAPFKASTQNQSQSQVSSLCHLEEVSNILLRGPLLHTMSQVHDMSHLCISCLADGLQHSLFYGFLATKQHTCIHISLICELGTSTCYTFCHVDSVTERDDVRVA